MKAINVFTSVACTVIAGMVGMVLFVALAGAAANPATPAPTDAKAAGASVQAQMTACPMCAMMKGEGESAGKGMEMTPAIKQRCQMMMNAEMPKDSAACLLAFKQELKLTAEQVESLEQIVKKSGQEAAAILTPDQQKILAEVAAQPASMNAMHSEMREKMKPKMEGSGSEKK